MGMNMEEVSSGMDPNVVAMKGLFKKMIDDGDLQKKYEADPIATLEGQGIDPAALPPELMEKITMAASSDDDKKTKSEVAQEATKHGATETAKHASEGGEAEGGEVEGGEVEGGEAEGGIVEASML